MLARDNWPIIDELQKQYEVVEVIELSRSPSAMMLSWPSTLVRRTAGNGQLHRGRQIGQPTAVFEDPFPVFAGRVPGTSAPRQMPGGMNMMMMGGGHRPRRATWPHSGTRWEIDFSGDQIVWQGLYPTQA